MKAAIPPLALALFLGIIPAAWAAPGDITTPSGLPSGPVGHSKPYQVAQAMPTATMGSGVFYDSMLITPFLYLKTDALLEKRSLMRGVWGATFEYNHFAIGDSMKLVLQYQGQYFHFFNVPSDRSFFHRGAVHLMKQFGNFNWHVGAQALLKHPAFDVGIRPIDQLYYTVVEHPIGLFGFSLFNLGLSFDYFRAGIAGNSYYAPGLVIGYSPPLGDLFNTGFGYRLQYRVATDGGISGLRHLVGFNFNPNFVSMMPVNVNVGVEAQKGQPLSFVFSTGIGFSPPISLQKVEKPPVPAEPGQAPAQNQFTEERLKTLGIPAIQPADPVAPGSSAIDSGSTTGREVNVIFR